jgi:hypothetical protein
MSPPLRLFAAAALFVLPCAASLAAADPAGTLSCSVANAAFGSAELVCPIAPAGQTQALHFHVSFEGVHDDSSAGLAARLDGQALACAPGSRVRLQGDGEGDTLSCRMAVPPASAARELRLQLVWSHAEPAPYTLRRE